ncbi:MAG: glutamate-5-semialdehyde dehydrogenase [Actinomycetota bacterium]|nr:glutamate-5-semialdehyde dehydrogenase [Actinomycetota bacterium]
MATSPTKAPAALRELGERARRASYVLATASSAAKDAALSAAADCLEAAGAAILAANRADLERARAEGSSDTVLDRLRLDERRVAAMAEGLRAVMALADPVGAIVSGSVRPNGLKVRRVRVPLGVIGIVYENRPNVTSDAAALCVKSGNAVLLRGSAGALESNKAITTALREGIAKAGLPADAVQLVEDARRETVAEFVRLRGLIDCLVPRGGHGLVSLVMEQATVPFVLDGDGNCHVYVDAAADLAMAEEIVRNAKTQRPSVCNAAETLLVHEQIAAEFLPRLAAAMPDVVLYGDPATRALVPRAEPASEVEYATEFLDLRLAVAVVADLDAAIAHIRRYSTGHSEAIVTGDLAAANRFVREVDAAAVLVNASTRFVDGGELGLGAEIGISTQKLHARGPMGLEELTCLKYVIEGEGQIRR